MLIYFFHFSSISNLQPENTEVLPTNQHSVSPIPADLYNVKFRRQRKVRGRPKGAVTNAIGLPLTKRARIVRKPCPFKDKTENEKTELILRWFVSDECIKNYNEENLIGEDEVEIEVQNISSAVKDNINIDVIKHFFDEDGWKAVLHAYNERRKLPYLCKKCYKDADEPGTNAVFCDSCCEWLHYTCTGITRKPRCNIWFCKDCK